MAVLEATNILLLPTDELPEGTIAQIRNQIKTQLLDLASIQLKIARKDLVVRDLRWVEDIAGLSAVATAAVNNNWIYTGAGAAGYVTVTGATSLPVNKFIALYGARDLRWNYCAQAAAPTGGVDSQALCQNVSLIKIDVGGGTRAIWDLSKIQCCPEMSGICPSAVIIQQMQSYEIWYYQTILFAAPVRIVLDGMCCEPRGLTISP